MAEPPCLQARLTASAQERFKNQIKMDTAHPDWRALTKLLERPYEGSVGQKNDSSSLQREPMLMKNQNKVSLRHCLGDKRLSR